jgi:hypothetical protein
VLNANVPGVSYSWQDTTTGPLSNADSLVVTEAGVYVLEISDQCASASDTVVVTQNSNPPSVDLPDSLGVCEGDTIVINSGVSGVAYLWQDGSVESQHLATLPGIYYVQVSNACGTDSDTTIVLDLGSAPIVNLGADTSLCAGAAFTLIPISSNVDTWLWQDGSTGSMFDVQSSGTIIVDATNQCGTVSDTLVVTELPDVPPLDLGSDLTLCPGESETLSISIPGVDILWSDNSIDTDFEVNAGGLVFATISNACGSSSDTVQVTLLDTIPDLDLGADQSLCTGETITIDPGIPGVDYLWNDGSVETEYIASLPGVVILTISNSCGSASDTIEIVLDPNGPMVDLGPDVLACEGLLPTSQTRTSPSKR